MPKDGSGALTEETRTLIYLAVAGYRQPRLRGGYDQQGEWTADRPGQAPGDFQDRPLRRSHPHPRQRRAFARQPEVPGLTRSHQRQSRKTMKPTVADQPVEGPASGNQQSKAVDAGALADAPTLGELLRTTAHLGAIGYGGPAILALMKQTLVTKKKWITEKDFMDALSLAQALPGATGVTVLGYVGFKVKRIWGGVIAPLGFVTPPTLLMLALSWAYFAYGQLSFVKSLFAGLGALVVALLLNATVVLGRSVFGKLSRDDWRGALIAAAGFTGVHFLHANVLWVVLAAALLGILLFLPCASEAQQFRTHKPHKPQSDSLRVPSYPQLSSQLS